jgi:hypothetical protein
MNSNMRRYLALLILGGVLPVAGTSFCTAAQYDAATTQQIVDRLVERFHKMPISELTAMPTLPVRKYALPTAGIDVMRAVVEERYEIDAVGTDTVMLTGWIAVKHNTPHAAPGSPTVHWGGAQAETEFVGLELSGRSELFGSVRVVLSPTRKSFWVVGWWNPDDPPAEARLLQKMYDEEARAGGADAQVQLAQDAPARVPGFGGMDLEIKRDGQRQELVPSLPPDRLGPSVPQVQPGQPGVKSAVCGLALSFAARGACCAVSLNVDVDLNDLGLRMTTQDPVYMHSYVETIPPVGYTATVSLTPAVLIMSGRHVGTLTHAAVRFRELVYHETLDPSVDPSTRLREGISANP